MEGEKLRRAIVIGPFEGEPCDEPGFGAESTFSNSALLLEPPALAVEDLKAAVAEIEANCRDLAGINPPTQEVRPFFREFAPGVKLDVYSVADLRLKAGEYRLLNMDGKEPTCWAYSYYAPKGTLTVVDGVLFVSRGDLAKAK